jgi:uncharacterized protein HemX
MTTTLAALLLLVICVGISFFIYRGKQNAREKAILEAAEAQRKATNLLGNAALALERGDRASAGHFLNEAHRLLKSEPSAPPKEN